jgi:sec-independent protein translocase protein TatB
MGLENIGGWELIVIILVGLFIFGPDRLPKAISDGVRMLRNLRQMARNATGDLSRELGTNIELEDLHPKTFLRKHLLSEADEAALRRPLDDLVTDARGIGRAFDLDSGSRTTSGTAAAVRVATAADAASVLEQSTAQDTSGTGSSTATPGSAAGNGNPNANANGNGVAPAGAGEGAVAGGQARAGGYTPRHGYDHDAT